MNFKFFLTALFCILFVVPEYAQIDLGKIARDAKRTVNRRVDRNIDRAIDNTLDEAEDVVRGRNKKKNKDGDIVYYDDTGTEIIRVVSPNSFKGQFLISRDVTDGNDDSNMYLVAMTEFETAIRPLMAKVPHNLIIYNKEELTQTTINNEKYKGRAMKDWVLMEEVNEKKMAETEKTDDIEVMNGYVARKYIVKTRDYEGEIWFTKEIDAELRVFTHLLQLDDLMLDPGLGFPLKMTLNYDDGHTESLSVSDIKEEADTSIFDISEYDLIDLTDLESGK